MSPRYRRGASLAVGGMFVVAGTLLAGAPIASATRSADAAREVAELAAARERVAERLGARQCHQRPLHPGCADR